MAPDAQTSEAPRPKATRKNRRSTLPIPPHSITDATPRGNDNMITDAI